MSDPFASSSRLSRLIAAALVTEPTAEVLKSRLDPPASIRPQFLDAETFVILVALCGRLRPKYPRPLALDLALSIDDRIAHGVGDGWRYDEMPPDRVAMIGGLRSLDAEARKTRGQAFSALPGEEADELLCSVRAGDVSADWGGISPARFFEELLAETSTLCYAHPDVQEAIGYVGYADAKGWTRIGLNEREPWE